MTEQPSQPRALDRQRRILDAALAVFSRRGYREASVDEIAEEAETSKGGVYFHFPAKQMIFRALLDVSAKRLLERVEAAIERETRPVAKADAALLTVLDAFADHRALARLFMIEALGAGGEFQERLLQIHSDFIAVIKLHLDTALAEGVIHDVDTDIASRAWFGALNEVILHWLIKGTPARLEDAYTALRPLLMRSVGIEAPAAAPPRGRLANGQAGDRAGH
ncbi:MAG: TetR family transcriptional regulator [Dehalococcoidia bacterium]|nr:TetR family transcriptional regulator [Dehalococcoidia bacterium]